MKLSKIAQTLSAALLALSLVACGGNDASYGTVSGTVTGLDSGQSVTLQNNGADTLTVTGNTSFAFATALVELTKFTVTVLTPPPGKTCPVTRGAGVIPNDGSSANRILVACAPNSIAGTVTGLAPGESVSLDNGAGAQVVVDQNTAFTFPGILAAGTAYAVSVTGQPANKSCGVANPSGTAAAGVQARVTVSCG